MILETNWRRFGIHCSLSYSPHEGKSRLRFMTTDPWSLDSAILDTRAKGVGFDSSHRNMNENFAPVTLLTTCNEFGCMAPSKAVFLSCQCIDILTSTISRILHLRGYINRFLRAVSE